MPRKIEGYECYRCSSLYAKEEQATICEDGHPATSQMIVRSATFAKLKGTYGVDYGHTQRYPKTVTVKFSDNPYDFATYRLDHVGYKGV